MHIFTANYQLIFMAINLWSNVINLFYISMKSIKQTNNHWIGFQKSRQTACVCNRQESVNHVMCKINARLYALYVFNTAINLRSIRLLSLLHRFCTIPTMVIKICKLYVQLIWMNGQSIHEKWARDGCANLFTNNSMFFSLRWDAGTICAPCQCDKLSEGHCGWLYIKIDHETIYMNKKTLFKLNKFNALEIFCYLNWCMRKLKNFELNTRK